MESETKKRKGIVEVYHLKNGNWMARFCDYDDYWASADSRQEAVEKLAFRFVKGECNIVDMGDEWDKTRSE